jgi:hypothetical protein
MKIKELLRVTVLGKLAVQQHATRMQLPRSKKTRALCSPISQSPASAKPRSPLRHVLEYPGRSAGRVAVELDAPATDHRRARLQTESSLTAKLLH